MLRGQNSVSASPVGGPEAMKKMVEFCARHKIIPEVEFFKMSEINEAIAHLKRVRQDIGSFWKTS